VDHLTFCVFPLILNAVALVLLIFLFASSRYWFTVMANCFSFHLLDVIVSMSVHYAFLVRNSSICTSHRAIS